MNNGGGGMTVRYRSGEMVTDRVGVVIEQRGRRNGMEYFVRWYDGSTGWYLASNVKFA